MSPFCKLADPAKYVACEWDLSRDADGRAGWVDFFKRHLKTTLSLGIEAGAKHGESMDSLARRAAACTADFFARFDEFAQHPDRFGRVTIIVLDRWRDSFLTRHGFPDAYFDLKNRENERVLPLLPVVCREIDSLSGPEQFRAITEGVFAGNIFDMGAEATARAFIDGGPDFFATRHALRPRPWLVDDYDALAARMLHRPAHRKVVFFIDNAGSDFLLGALPMMRWMAMRGTHIILAANERPTLNDMTIHDVNAWWPGIVEAEPSFAALPIERVSTGTSEPLIDLSEISDVLNAAAADADLVILEGMGRGVESNLNAQFSCDALNLAMIKDQMVAHHIGGRVFDIVCKFQPSSH
jgi:type II pantothenate kinase